MSVAFDKALAAMLSEDAYITHPREVTSLQAAPEAHVFLHEPLSARWADGSDVEREAALQEAKRTAGRCVQWCAERGVRVEVDIVSGEPFHSGGLYLVTPSAFETPEVFEATVAKHGVSRVSGDLSADFVPSTTTLDALLRHDLLGDIAAVATRHRELLTMAMRWFDHTEPGREALYLRCENLLVHGAHYPYKKDGALSRIALESAKCEAFGNNLFQCFEGEAWAPPGDVFMTRMLDLYIRHERVSLERPVITQSQFTGNAIERLPVERAIAHRNAGLFSALLTLAEPPSLPNEDFRLKGAVVAKKGDLQAYLDWINDGQELATIYRAHCMRAALAREGAGAQAPKTPQADESARSPSARRSPL